MIRIDGKFLVGIAAATLTACAPTFSTRPIDARADETATGLRYMKSHRTEVRVYRVSLPNEVRDPAKPPPNTIERVGDAVVDSLADPSQLWVVDFKGAPFGNRTLTLSNGTNGTVSTLGVTSNSGDTSAGLGSLQAVQTLLQTERDYSKTKEQAKIDELTRQKNLIQALKDLQAAMASP